MSVRFPCPGCGTTLHVPEAALGRKGRCPKCAAVFTTPAPQPAADPRAVAHTLRPDPADDLDAPAPEPALGEDRAAVETRHDDAPAGAEGPAAPGPEPGLGVLGPLGQIGRFELRAALGQGAFGKVYRAYDPVLDRPVALKIPKFPPDQPGQLERFLGEAKAAARLRHPNLVAVFEIGQAGADHYIAAEFVEGMPLSVRLAERPPSFRRAAQWVRDLARGLAYAHDQGVVHRDIKPANIMIGANDRPQLMDFGLAKRAAGADLVAGSAPSDAAADQTREGAVVGTPAYMAPEQARGDLRAVGPHSDQYSLGVVLYEMLTGRKPFDGPVRAVLARVIAREPPDPREINPDIPKDLETVCLKAMAKEPGRRYASVHELADDLARWLRREPILAAPPTVREWLVRWCQRSPGLAAASGLAAAGLLLVVVLGVAFLVYRARTAEERRRLVHEAEEARQLQQQQLDEAVRAAREERQRGQRSDYHLYRERGLRRIAEGSPAEGVLCLARAFEMARGAGDESLQETVRGELVRWAHEVKAPSGVEPWPRNLWDEAAQRMLGLPPATPGVRPPPPWDEAAARLIGRPLAHPDPIAFTAFRPDGRSVVTVSGRESRLWDAATGKPLGPPVTYEGGEQARALSADGRTVVTQGGPNGTLRLRDAATGEALGPPILPQTGGVGAVFLGPDGKTSVVRGSWGRLWDSATGASLGPQIDHDWHADYPVFSPDGRTLASVGRGRAQLWDARSGRVLGKEFDAKLPREGVVALALAPDGKTLLTNGMDGKAHFWDATKGKETGEPLQPGSPIIALAFSPDGQTVLVCGARSARLWSVAGRRPVGEPLRHPAPLTAGAFSGGGRLVVTWGGSAVQVWEAATGKPLGLPLAGTSAAPRPGRPYAPPPPSVPGAVLSTDGTMILTTDGPEVRLWTTPDTEVDWAEGVNLWAQLLTGKEVGPDGKFPALSGADWEQRRRRFERLVGIAGR
jgi:WD40 repeat protein